MERNTSYLEAKELFGINFIGIDELKAIKKKLPLEIPLEIPEINFPKEVLYMNRNTHILILSVNKFSNKDLNILNLRQFFGILPDSNLNFYNQDWYLKEEFTTQTLNVEWNLIKKDLIEDSRGISPDVLSTSASWPTAILCTYTFFIYYLCRNIILWEHDFVWCKDLDHNGDQIYVGKFSDITGVNKNGFSIHRHLKIKNNYGTITCL
jgi:hypothetical protein